METPPALSHEIWEQTPPEAQAYIRALEARVETLRRHGPCVAGAGPHVTRTAQPDLAEFFTPTIERPASVSDVQIVLGVSAVVAVNRAIPAIPAPLIPVDEVDEVVVLKPEQCTHCQAPLSGDDPTPWRHQVIEMPPIKPVVTEYQWHQLVCPACGETTRAPWPAGRSQRHLRSPRASHGGAVYGGVSLIQAHDPAGDGRACSVCP